MSLTGKIRRSIEFLRGTVGLKTADEQNHSPDYKSLDPQLYKAFNRFRPLGPQPVFCYVPFNSLTFSFSGKVFACTYNRRILLGKYPENSIEEIWTGTEANTLRNHMWHNDLSYGCDHCKYFFDKGKFSNLKPMVFDKYAGNRSNRFPQVMEFEMSNECNFECQMCVGEVSSSIRKNRDHLPPIPMPYDSAFVEQLSVYIPHLKEAKFYGGEPFLISLYYDIWEKIAELNPDINMFIITNGSHWNQKIRNVLYKGNFDLAVSMDALDKNLIEKIRKNTVYEKLLTNIDHFNEYCQSRGKYLTISYTAQQDNWQEMPKMIEFCNAKNCFIYVSYLEWPPQFAIPSLSREKIREIYEQLEKFDFPNDKKHEKHNRICYQDFLNFLLKYCGEEEQKKYLEYQQSGWTEIKNEPGTIPEDQAADPENYLRKNLYEHILKLSFSKEIAETESEILLKKNREILSSCSDTEKEDALKLIAQSPIHEVYNQLKNTPKEILIRRLQNEVLNKS